MACIFLSLPLIPMDHKYVTGPYRFLPLMSARADPFQGRFPSGQKDEINSFRCRLSLVWGP